MWNKLRLISTVAVLAAILGCSTPQQKAAKALEAGKEALKAKDYSKALLQFRIAVKEDGKNPDAHYQLAVGLMQSGDLRGAVNQLNLTLRLDPKHHDAQLAMAELMSSSAKPDVVKRSQEMAKEILAAKPDDADALQTLAATELRLGKASDATQHLEEALAKSPDHIRAALSLARVKLAQGDKAAAEQVLIKATQQPKPATEAFVALGEFYRLTGKSGDAQSQFQKALDVDPKNALALIDLGQLLVQAGKKDEAKPIYKRLSESGDAQYHPVYAMFLYATGDKNGALQEYERLYKASPNEKGNRPRLVSAYVDQGKLDQAWSVLNARLKENPKDSDALIQHAELSLRTGKLTDASSDIASVLRYQSNSPTAHQLAARIEAAQGNPLNQQKELREALRLDANAISARVELAQVLLDSGKAKDALSLMDETPDAQKTSIQFVIQRNWALLRSQQYKELAASFEKYVPKEPIPEITLQKGLLKHMQGNYAESRPILNDVLKGAPEEMRAVDALARGYLAQKQPKEAIALVEKLSNDNPKSGILKNYLGTLYVGLGDVASARKAFGTAQQIAPRAVEPYVELANLDLADKQYDSALKHLNDLIALDAGNVRAHSMAGTIYQLRKQNDQAIAEYRKALASNSKDLGTLNNLAFLLLESPGKVDEGLQLAQQAMELSPDTPFVLDTIGWAYYQKGLYRGAVDYLRKAVEKQPTAIRHYHYSMALVKSGNRNLAEQELKTAKRMDASLPEAKLAEELMAKR
jgi:tetratricopeptide (TPR) repeat protein